MLRPKKRNSQWPFIVSGIHYVWKSVPKDELTSRWWKMREKLLDERMGVFHVKDESAKRVSRGRKRRCNFALGRTASYPPLSSSSVVHFSIFYRSLSFSFPPPFSLSLSFFLPPYSLFFSTFPSPRRQQKVNGNRIISFVKYFLVFQCTTHSRRSFA